MIARRVLSPRHKGVTDQQVLDAIESLTATNGAAPSYRELAERLGMASTSSVGYRLRRLADRGKVVLTRGRSRSAAVADAPPHTEAPCPMCVKGEVPMEAYSEGEVDYQCAMCMDSKVICPICYEEMFALGARTTPQPTSAL